MLRLCITRHELGANSGDACRIGTGEKMTGKLFKSFAGLAKARWLVITASLIGSCTYAADGVGLPLDHAKPNIPIYVRITELGTPVATAAPFSEYILLETVANGYLVVLTQAPYYPPIGFILKTTRLGSQTATVKPGKIVMTSVYDTKIYPGYIPLLQSNLYPIVHQEGTNLFLLYENSCFTATARVDAASCTIIPSQERSERKILNDALAYSFSPADYDLRIKSLTAVLYKYANNSGIGAVRKRLAEMSTPEYRSFMAELSRAKGGDSTRAAVDAIQNAIKKYPSKELEEKGKSLVEELNKRATYKISEELALFNYTTCDAAGLQAEVTTLTSLTNLFGNASNTGEAIKLLEAKQAKLVSVNKMIADGYVKYEGTLVAPQVATERHAAVVAEAIGKANQAKTHQEAISLLVKVMPDHLQATNITELRTCLAKYQAELQLAVAAEAKARRAKAAASVAAPRYIDDPWGGGGMHFPDHRTAMNAAGRLNSQQQGSMDSAREMSGVTEQSMTLPSATLNRWKVVPCSLHNNCWTLQSFGRTQQSRGLYDAYNDAAQ